MKSKILKKQRKNVLEFSSGENNKEESVVDVDETEALEKATDSVIESLPQGKRKKYERKNWGDRPEHLRKPLGEMTKEEKAEYYKWKAGEVSLESQEYQKPAYDESEIYALGCVILPLLCARMPNPLPPTEQELQGFGRVMTPLANKYVSAFVYKEEVNAALFAFAFIIPRAKRTLVEMPLENYSG